MPITVNGKPILTLSDVQQEVRALTMIRVEDTFTELVEHSLRTETIASLHAQSVGQVEWLKTQIDRVEAGIYLVERQSIPKRSEKEIEAIQDSTPAIMELRDALIEAMAARVYMDDMARAFDSRGTMLVNLRKLIEAEAR